MANLEKVPTAGPKCLGCGADLTGDIALARLCPKCLLKLAMETRPATIPLHTEMLVEPATKGRGLPGPGEQFGPYRLINLLGAGGMGAVFEAEDVGSGRRVALKILSHALDSPEARERFFREGRLAASINHPNSVYIFGTEEIGGTPVIVMELVSGGTLQDRVRARGVLPVGEAVEAVLQIVAGLEAAQRLGVLHRDIKPSNCYIADDGTVKIGDFGLSISTVVRTDPSLTSTGAFLGTPAFCSPEQMRGEQLNIRSDMYSVGATLFYLLTGHTPFEGRTLVQLLATVLEEPAPTPRKYRSEIPQGLAKAVLRCLEKHAGDRFKDYHELANALTPYSLSAPTPATLSLRCLAGMVDMTFLCSVALLLNLSVFGSPMAFLNQAMQRSSRVFVCLMGWMFAATLYYALFEGLWGAALGKRLCRLRVVTSERNFPGILSAWIRALVFVILPVLPYWIDFSMDPNAYVSGSQLKQLFMGFSVYAIIGLLFITARRRNGFAALHDLLTRTRVVSRAALAPRHHLAANDVPPAMIDSTMAIGPYHVLQTLSESSSEKWFLAYDLKLLRKVWLRVGDVSLSPLPPNVRNIARPGRLRWLSGKRSPSENWDAFEALTGRSFLEVIQTPQPWSEVRFWIQDLAIEMAAAQTDNTLPVLNLNRVWITAEGRAKLLDVSGPGQASVEQGSQSWNDFLASAATLALTGSTVPSQPLGKISVPLAFHARAFLQTLPQLLSPGAVATTIKPLLGRVAEVSRLRRAALTGGCIAFPLLASAMGIFGFSFIQEMSRANPGLMQLNYVLQMRSSARSWHKQQVSTPTDYQISIYIAEHFRGLITNSTSWSNPMVAGMIRGEPREFAEQSIAEHPSVTRSQAEEADAVVRPWLPKEEIFSTRMSGGMPVMILTGALLLYVAIPSVLAALCFRGGLVLLVAGVTYARADGERASRPRLFWRALLVWGPLLPVCVVSTLAMVRHQTWEPWLALGLLAALSALSIALPQRGLQDRLAGTWPVPR